jgi:hypothetical protein
MRWSKNRLTALHDARAAVSRLDSVAMPASVLAQAVTFALRDERRHGVDELMAAGAMGLE